MRRGLARRAIRPGPSTATRSSYGNATSPTTRSSASGRTRYYITYNIFLDGGTSRAPRCAPRPGEDARRPAATQQCFKPRDNAYGGLLPVRRRRRRRRRRRDRRTSSSTAARTACSSGSSTSTGRRRRTRRLTGPTAFRVAAFTPACGGGDVHPAAGHDPEARLARRPADVPPRLPQLRRPRVARRQPQRERGRHRPAMRWYELREPERHADASSSRAPTRPDATYRWMGSVAMDHVGRHRPRLQRLEQHGPAGIRYTGRLVADPLGTMGQGEARSSAGTGSQTGGLAAGATTASMTVDPVDDCTFWYAGEYLTSNGTWNWHTRIGSFKFPSCTTRRRQPARRSRSFTPTSGPVGTNVDVTGTGFTGATRRDVRRRSRRRRSPSTRTPSPRHRAHRRPTGPIGVSTPNGTGASASSFTVTGGGGGNPPTVTSFTPDERPGRDERVRHRDRLHRRDEREVQRHGVDERHVQLRHEPDGARSHRGHDRQDRRDDAERHGHERVELHRHDRHVKPTISSFTPTQGKRGIQVTINGNNFNGATTVRLGCVSARSP